MLARSTLYTCTSFTHMQTEPTLITEDNMVPFHSPVDSFTTQGSCAWRCHSVSGSLVRGTHDLSHAASRRFPMILGDTTDATCAQISSLDTVQAATVLTHCIDLDMRLYCMAIQNLVYRCGNVPQTTVESSDAPPIHCVQHLQQSINMSIQLPAHLQCIPIQMAEVVQQEYILIGGVWLYPRVNVANTIHPSKRNSYCLQSQNRGLKDRPPEHPLIADDHDK